MVRWYGEVTRLDNTPILGYSMMLMQRLIECVTALEVNVSLVGCYVTVGFVAQNDF